ncbi:hypothetical protein HRG_012954 [Hirsutella rhossiliensis]
MAVGDEALAGKAEKDITQAFLPTANPRTIYFKGYYLSIYNQQTGDYKTHIDNEVASTEYKGHFVPAGYGVYVRGGSVYFQA